MKYSFIIPVYNVELYIRECLKAVAEQTFKDYEVILVDDGSTDHSGEICDEFKKNFEGKCQVIHKNNGGLSSARNAGLEVAKGEWIVFVDSDDYVSVQLLEKLEDAQQETLADLYSFNAMRIDREGNLFGKLVYAVENEHIRLKQAVDISEYIINNIATYTAGWEACFKCYRKRIIDEYKIRFIDTRQVFAEDLCFTLEYMLHVHSLYRICDMLYYYRLTPGSLIQNADRNTMLGRLYSLTEYIYEKCIVFNEPLAENYNRFFETLIVYHIIYKMKGYSDEMIEEQLQWIRENTRYGKNWADIDIRGIKRIER
ncbi:glycosyltransferase family 2 protein [Butyrivibrio sp. NC2007]|uniref:glycosyltransferase family 2 protein n=1 Tax=Butyrivibrio sp. NC2007 TaxID=1280683 RepID=UPI0003B70D88|nr:glycosyltransferase family 2 protein [Butyrivibrio sp. NC2007]